jgi:hypothetical protein
MSHWLSDAVRALRRGAAPAPVEFHVRCGCGATLNGLRTRNHQELVCEHCAQRLFILPISAYPPGRAAVHTPATRPPAQAGVAIGKTARQKPAKQAKQSSPPAARLAGIRQQSMARAGRGLRRLCTPFRLVILATSLVLIATGAWMSHARAIAQARITLSESGRKGREALHNGDYTVAAADLERACRALDLLGRNDVEARGLRQMRREATALSQLAPHNLFELIGEAIQTRERPGGMDWPEAFRGTYHGTWVILDTTAQRPLAAGAASQTQLEIPLIVQGQPVSLRADFSAFEHLLIDAQPKRVVFAAQLEDCRASAADPAGWEIIFKSETAFLWSDAKSYLGSGFGAGDPAEDAQTEQTLATQMRLLGIEP